MLKRILFNQRIKDYERLLKKALDCGYEIGTLERFYNKKEDNHFVLLRHDVDKKMGVSEILEIENSLGVAGTWYFRWNTLNKKWIHQILSKGGEVGLHYETLARLIKKYRIKHCDQVNTEIVMEFKKELLKEIELFRSEVKVYCLTIASHGHPLNRKIGITNYDFIDDEFLSMAGLKTHAYDKKLMDRIVRYVCDFPLFNNSGWAHCSLDHALNKKFKHIYLLIHPHHWYFNHYGKFVNIIRACMFNIQKKYNNNPGNQ